MSLEGIANHVMAEERAARTYLKLAAWCELNSYPGCAKHFFGESKEEFEHVQEMMQYALDRNQDVEIGAQAAISKVESLAHAFNSALTLEESIFRKLQDLSAACAKASDYDSVRFLQKFLEIGTNSIRDLTVYVDQLKRVGNDGCGLLVFDSQFGG